MDSPNHAAANSQRHQLTTEDLKSWLEKYADANAVLAQKVDACERENMKLRRQNEELEKKLQIMCETASRNRGRSCLFSGDGNQEEAVPCERISYNEDETAEDDEGTLQKRISDSQEGAIYAVPFMQLAESLRGQLTVSRDVGKVSTFDCTADCKMADMEPSYKPLRELDDQEEPHHEETGLDDQVVRSHSTSDKVSMSARSLKILLAEDNQVNVTVVISMLKRLGVTAKVVANGVEALAAIRKDKYDLVLLDICMPLMDGLQVAHAIRSFEQTGHWPAGEPSAGDSGTDDLHQAKSGQPEQHLPIVAVTANASRSDVDRCFAHGVDAFIAKPVMFQKLQEIVDQYLPSGT